VRRSLPAIAFLFLVAGCSYRSPAPAPNARSAAVPVEWLRSETTSRAAETSFRRRVVEIAMSEWRRWGAQATHRNGPKQYHTGYGAWIGYYWQVATGRESRAAWSGAFVSYVMKQAGAGESWPATGSHAYYIRLATQNRERRSGAFWARRLGEYAPRPGDLVCNALEGGIDYDRQPDRNYASHCDIVVDVRDGWIAVVGGNLSNSVAKRALMTDSAGRLVNPQPRQFDPAVRNWFVVIETRR
jgi:hypothetical protein